MSLVAVVGLAKILSPMIEAAVAGAGAPKTVIGIAIAMLVLMPEALGSDTRRARESAPDEHQPRDRLGAGQHRADDPGGRGRGDLLDIPLVLGLAPKDLVMLVVTFLVSIVTLASGRTHMMQGAVHLVLFATFTLPCLRAVRGAARATARRRTGSRC